MTDEETIRAELIELIYELLDAHDDTAAILSRALRGVNPRTELVWRAHLDYLRDLQREGRRIVAACAAPAMCRTRTPG
jgi:hypothetical protein